MAKRKKEGSVEIADIYAPRPGTVDIKGVMVGRLAIDYDKREFWERRADRAATRLSAEEVGVLIANDLLVFDQPDMRSTVTEYLMRLTEEKQTIRQAEIDAIKSTRAAEEMEQESRLHKIVKRKARRAKIIWVFACLILIGLAFIATIPAPSLNEAIASIAGVGQDYGIESELLNDVTYIETLGNANKLYGIVLDTDIVEVGQTNTGESTIKENVLINPEISSEPTHLRPLYYDRTNFYQTEIVTNDANTSSSAVYLQNPNGYSLGVPSNELILTGGSGLASVVLASPEKFSDQSASETANQIESEQEQAIRGETRAKTVDPEPAQMAAGWNGFDSCDIDSNVVVASYWYTKNASLQRTDLKRRIAVFDISNVLASGSRALSSLEAVQLNYQDLDSDFYAPVVSQSPAYNGSVYWIGYMKEVNGNSGFFIRKYELNEDILKEDYDNTLSVTDLTGNGNPISNYTLNGDKLFYEQAGSIWVLDLSKVEIEIQGIQRTVRRENPVEICKTSEIRPTITRDEEYVANVHGTTIAPAAHYKVMTVTTDAGVQYGISFIEADTGDLVYQPCVSTIAAASEINQGTGSESTANGVYSTDEAAQAKADAENKAREEARAARNRNSSSSGNTNSSVEETDTNGDSANESDGTVGGLESAEEGSIVSDLINNMKEGMKQTTGTDIANTFQSEEAAPVPTEQPIPEAVPIPEENTEGNSASNGDQNENTNSSANNVNTEKSQSKNENLNVSEENENKAQILYSSTENTADSNSSSTRDEINNGRILIRAGKDNNILIVCYSVRGEQLVWVEEDKNTGKRKVLFSPVYYKNDAYQILSESLEEEEIQEDTNTSVLDGIQPAEETGEAVGSDSQSEVPIENENTNTSSQNKNQNGNTNTSNENVNSAPPAQQNQNAAPSAENQNTQPEEPEASHGFKRLK